MMMHYTDPCYKLRACVGGGGLRAGYRLAFTHRGGLPNLIAAQDSPQTAAACGSSPGGVGSSPGGVGANITSISASAADAQPAVHGVLHRWAHACRGSKPQPQPRPRIQG